MEWEREEWIAEYQGGETVSEIARRHEVSRRVVHKWIGRYEQYGEEGLRDLSRAPHRHPGAVSGVWRERIAAARGEHPRWGARKLEWLLEQRHEGEAPSASTIGRVLSEMGLSRKRRPAVRAHGTGVLEEAQHSNEVWAIDFKGWCRTADGQRCEPLTVTDQATRYLLCCQAVQSTRTEVVRRVLEQVFRRYGVPQRIRSDNGAPFASRGECGLTELSVWWIELGMECERIEPGHPQQNGRHERMHRTLKEEAMEPPASTLRQQQRRLDAFREEYNQRRPHEGLGQRVPAEVYQPGLRAYPERVREPEYACGWAVRRVEDGGRVKWQGERLFVSHALTGKLVGWEAVAEDLWRVWFHRHWLGMWDGRQQRLWRPRHWTRQESRRSPSGLAAGSPGGIG